MAQPKPAPNTIWANTIQANPHPDAVPFTTEIMMAVSIYAAGSLLPLSISSIGAVLFLRPSFFPLRMEKTEAASVELTTAPRRKLSAHPHRSAKWQNKPVRPAVTTTPNDASSTDSCTTGFTASQRVPKPP